MSVPRVKMLLLELERRENETSEWRKRAWVAEDAVANQRLTAEADRQKQEVVIEWLVSKAFPKIP